MTSDEIKVIAAAAAAFVIINIIMWTVIAVKEKRERRLAEQSAPAYSAAQTFGAAPGNTAPLRRNAPAVPAEEELPGFHLPSKEDAQRQIRSDFQLIDSTVIIHTDEWI